MDVQFPIGKLEVPEHVTTEHVQEWLGKISSYTARLREAVDGLNDEQLGKKYREGSWTVRQLVHHIADSQLTMYQRLRLALTDDNPTVPAFNQEKWAELPDNELPVESSIRILEGLNERIVVIGKHVTDEQLKRVFTHETNGEISVATKLAKLCWHEEHHLEHIKIALEK
ncbi:YfiT family bacillithiol transferase [Planococcus glaciei]|uniref:Putative metal-dependent hydrolase n=1 Tax=Planococcus glaciei TaxID=459472 RepID=A0A7H8QCF8_9BACL|nr:putative metal-dependent hydrolase [Planococcus glaciei]MBX0315315.1 putative metal-dependent hydrolase [Planococcus glaciei]QDY45807.1 putative metal-dependent hydrolase [Planococcus glaciei]QKX51045.1 putative metal-dependent hydrolase [Planococcus glaciei]